MPANGSLDVEDYAEGQYVHGSYDLHFADGTDVIGSFDAGWCP